MLNQIFRFPAVIRTCESEIREESFSPNLTISSFQDKKKKKNSMSLDGVPPISIHLNSGRMCPKSRGPFFNLVTDLKVEGCQKINERDSPTDATGGDEELKPLA
ncbi:hypothetical protein TNIN_342711 [Trichonephila inaurata madagascariensis]|uniref:Uncharacterized protein n=1 Tax=Trichonephila inaurata madagascariensis TaxID=2747483 RepID=A0A8X6XDG7_9ARAC|nr:hypothetical protein TNIN_342711 [Trichonephila inaurata madagascariensis]